MLLRSIIIGLAVLASYPAMADHKKTKAADSEYAQHAVVYEGRRHDCLKVAQADAMGEPTPTEISDGAMILCMLFKDTRKPIVAGEVLSVINKLTRPSQLKPQWDGITRFPAPLDADRG